MTTLTQDDQRSACQFSILLEVTETGLANDTIVHSHPGEDMILQQQTFIRHIIYCERLDAALQSLFFHEHIIQF